jgi:hypothetical protein
MVGARRYGTENNYQNYNVELETHTMGFFRQQEEKIAMRFLSWQYQKLDLPAPDNAELARQAARIVEEAHQIARERGSNVISIMKDLIADLKKR